MCSPVFEVDSLLNNSMSLDELIDIKNKNEYISGKVVDINSNEDIIVEISDNLRGIVFKEDIAYRLDENYLGDKDIKFLMGKILLFKIVAINSIDSIILSRGILQKKFFDDYISKLKIGQVIPCRVISSSSTAIYLELGFGIMGRLRVQNFSISRIHTGDIVKNYHELNCVVKELFSNGNIELTHKELLGTWLENTEDIEIGEMYVGVVENFVRGQVLVKIASNLVLLCRLTISSNDIKEGVSVVVKITHKNTDSASIYANIISYVCDYRPYFKLKYRIKAGQIIKYWDYYEGIIGRNKVSVFKQ